MAGLVSQAVAGIVAVGRQIVNRDCAERRSYKRGAWQYRND